MWELFICLTVSMQSSESCTCRRESVQRKVSRGRGLLTDVEIVTSSCSDMNALNTFCRLRDELPQTVQGPGSLRVQEEHQSDQLHRQSDAELHASRHGQLRGWAWPQLMTFIGSKKHLSMTTSAPCHLSSDNNATSGAGRIVYGTILSGHLIN